MIQLSPFAVEQRAARFLRERGVKHGGSVRPTKSCGASFVLVGKKDFHPVADPLGLHYRYGSR
jgi:hypothetical protein